MFLGDPPGNTDRILDFSTAVDRQPLLRPDGCLLETRPRTERANRRSRILRSGLVPVDRDNRSDERGDNLGHERGDNRWLASDVPRGPAYDQRFVDLAARGVAVHGEADFVAAYEPASVLDAGCGTGRVAIELHRRGVEVTGVDLDPVMLAAAREKEPSLSWIEADLADLELGRRFDLVVAAGNVLIFVAPGAEPAVIAGLARHLHPGGVLVAGFSLRRHSLGLERYDQLAADCGLELVERYATWERARYAGGDYAVSVHRGFA